MAVQVNETKVVNGSLVSVTPERHPNTVYYVNKRPDIITDAEVDVKIEAAITADNARDDVAYLSLNNEKHPVFMTLPPLP